jgi:hypothetical protein
MSFCHDKTGHPYAWCCDLNMWVSVFPLTKYQFEAWLCSGYGPGDDVYSEILKEAPRLSKRSISNATSLDGAIACGVLFEEVAALSDWLGGGARILKAGEWRTAMREFEHRSTNLVMSKSIDSNVVELWKRSKMIQSDENLARVCMFGEHFAEWVVHGKSHGLLGRPPGTTWPKFDAQPLTLFQEAQRDRRFVGRLAIEGREL